MSSSPSFPASQSNSQNPSVKVEEGPTKESKDTSIRASNPKIFPSLHPIGNFYNEKSNKSLNKTQFCYEEPTKKVKMNDQSDKLVKSISVPLTKTTYLQDQNAPSFPQNNLYLQQLAERFNNLKAQGLSFPRPVAEFKVQEKPQINVQQPLVVPDNVFKGLNKFQWPDIQSFNGPDLREDPGFKTQVCSQLLNDLRSSFSVANNYSSALVNNLQGTVPFDREKLEMEYFAIQFTSNINNFLKVIEKK